MQGPQLVIMVPTRELGVQIVMLIYKLFGGAVNSQVPGDAANMFTYTGPRGLKVGAAVDIKSLGLCPSLGVLPNALCESRCCHNGPSKSSAALASLLIFGERDAMFGEDIGWGVVRGGGGTSSSQLVGLLG